MCDTSNFKKIEKIIKNSNTIRILKNMVKFI